MRSDSGYLPAATAPSPNRTRLATHWGRVPPRSRQQSSTTFWTTDGTAPMNYAHSFFFLRELSREYASFLQREGAQWEAPKGVSVQSMQRCVFPATQRGAEASRGHRSKRTVSSHRPPLCSARRVALSACPYRVGIPPGPGKSKDDLSLKIYAAVFRNRRSL